MQTKLDLYAQSINAYENAQRIKAIAEQKRAQAQYEAEQRTSRLIASADEIVKNNSNPLLRGLATLGDFQISLLEGIRKSVEGVVDLAATGVGAVGGLFSSDFQDAVKDFIATDLVEEQSSFLHYDELQKYSYLNDGDVGSIVRGIASGVGQMLPTVLVAIATGGGSVAAQGASTAAQGASAAAQGASTAAQAASLAYMGASAAGNATEEAFQDGAEYYPGLGYGVASGLVEVGTEKIFGGVNKALTGSGVIRHSVADIGAKRVLKNIAEEGAEEMLSEAASPALKTIYKGPDALSEYSSPDFKKNLLVAGAVGAGTAGVYGGTVGRALAKSGYGYSGKEADIADSLHEALTLQKKAANLQTSDRLNEKLISIDTDILKNYENVEKVLSSVSESRRSELLKKFDLEGDFDADGKLSASLRARFDVNDRSGKGFYSSDAPLPRSSYSYNLYGHEDVIRDDLKQLTEARAKAFRAEREKSGESVTMDQARQAVGDFSVFSGELTEKGKSARKYFMQFINALNRASGDNISFVAVAPNNEFRAANIGNRIYISTDVFENGSWAESEVHEYTHISEGSPEYASLARLLNSDDFIVDDENGGKISLRQKALDAVMSKDYGFTAEQIDTLANKPSSELTEKERLAVNTFFSELVAHESAMLFGNADFVSRVILRDASFAKKFFAKIADLKKAFSRISDPAAKAEYKRLRAAESVWLSAAKASRSASFIRYMVSRDDELKEEAEKGSFELREKDNEKTIENETEKEYNEENTKRSEKNEREGNQDAEILAKREISASHRGGNGLWKQGQDPEEVYQRLANSQTDQGSYGKTRAGSSGWLGDIRGDKSYVLRLREGVLRDLRGKALSGKDTAGRTLSESVKRKFARSVLKSDSGELLSLYHWTDADFRIFAKGDIGFHFGTLNASHERYNDVSQNIHINKSFYKECYVNITNPAVINFDPMTWSVFSASYKLNEQGIITDEEISKLQILDGFFKSSYDSPASVELRRMLKNKGYDGIIYSNAFEGDLSVIAFSADQIVTVAENGIDADAATDRENNDIRFELKEKEKYSEYDKPITVKDVEVLRSIKRKSINEFTSEDIEKAQKWAYKFYREIGTKSPFFRAWFGEWRAQDVAPVGIADIPAYIGTNEARKAQRGNVVNADTGWEIRISREGETNTISHSGDEHLSEYGLSGIRSLVENAVLLDSEVHEHHSNNAKNDMIAFDHKLYSLGKDSSGNIAVYRITVEEMFQDPYHTNEKRFHNLKYIEKVAEVSADANVEQSHKDGSTMRNSTTTYSISDLYRFVKTFDKEFSAAPEANPFMLEEYTDENGVKRTRPKVFYHGTFENWTEYDLQKNVNQMWGDGIYLTPYPERARLYGDNIMAFYVKADTDYRTAKTTGKPKDYTVIKQTGDVIVYSPNQIKSATDNIGTFDRTNPDIRFDLVEKKNSEISVTDDEYNFTVNKESNTPPDDPYYEGFLLQEIAVRQAENVELKDKNEKVNSVAKLADKFKEMSFGAFQNATQFHPDILQKIQREMAKIEWRGNINKASARKHIGELYRWYSSNREVLGDRYIAEMADIMQSLAPFTSTLCAEDQSRIDSVTNAFLKAGNSFSCKPDDLLGMYRILNSFYTKNGLRKLNEARKVDGLEPLNLSYDDETKRLLSFLSSNDEFNLYELDMLDKVLKYVMRFVSDYNTVLRDGKRVDAIPVAKDYISIFEEKKKINEGVFRNLFTKYLYAFADPMAFARFIDGYNENGFFTHTISELRKGETNASIMENRFHEPIEDFYSDFHKRTHKNFISSCEEHSVSYLGYQIPASKAMALYCTLKRDHAVPGLALSGFKYLDEKDTTFRIEGFSDQKASLSDMMNGAKHQLTLLKEQFTDDELAFIKIVEKLMNNDLREAKRLADIERQGYSNVTNGYYFPIHRDNISKDMEDITVFSKEITSVNNASFNKNTVKGAKGELFLSDIFTVTNRHIRGISLYSNLSSCIDEFNMIFNLDVSGNPNKPVSVRTASDDHWKDGANYILKLLEDIKGVERAKISKDFGEKLTSKVRSGYAISVLALNPKVLATQLSSIFASASILDFDCVFKGFFGRGSDVDKYCPLAKVRNSENTVALAKGVLDKTQRLGSFLMKPIGKMDRLVVTKLFRACQLQVQKNENLALGSEENKIRAGELLTNVILETQQNATATNRSAAMRSPSEFLKSVVMFTSDAMKVVGRVIDATGSYATLFRARNQMKNSGGDAARLASLESDLKHAGTKLKKSVFALLSSAVYMSLIGLLFSKIIYKKDDEEEEPAALAKEFSADVFGNMIGGLPFLSDFYEGILKGYDISSSSYSVINDLVGSFNTLARTVFSDKSSPQDYASCIRTLFLSAGKLFGIPVSNVERIFNSAIYRISPSAAYAKDSIFYEKSYSSDLAKAIENGDDSMISTISALMLNQNFGSVKNESVRIELDRLIRSGLDVLPRSIGDSIAYDGEVISLTKRQRERFESVYFRASDELASLISSELYRSADEDTRAKSIRYVYSLYYNLALEDLLGIELETKNSLFSKAVPVYKLAIILSTASSLSADLDKNGSPIAGSKKNKLIAFLESLKLSAAQKHILLGYFGYKNSLGQSQVRSFIQSLPLTKSEKETLFAMSGY